MCLCRGSFENGSRWSCGESACASKSHFNWHPMCSGIFPCTDSVCQHGTKSVILAPLRLHCACHTVQTAEPLQTAEACPAASSPVNLGPQARRYSIQVPLYWQPGTGHRILHPVILFHSRQFHSRHILQQLGVSSPFKLGPQHLAQCTIHSAKMCSRAVATTSMHLPTTGRCVMSSVACQWRGL